MEGDGPKTYWTRELANDELILVSDTPSPPTLKGARRFPAAARSPAPPTLSSLAHSGRDPLCSGLKCKQKSSRRQFRPEEITVRWLAGERGGSGGRAGARDMLRCRPLSKPTHPGGDLLTYLNQPPLQLSSACVGSARSQSSLCRKGFPHLTILHFAA